jgi:hypothetical protein
MAIFAYSPELRQEFRRQHRRETVRLRARKRKRQAEKPKDDRRVNKDWLNAIERDENDDERLETS